MVFAVSAMSLVTAVGCDGPEDSGGSGAIQNDDPTTPTSSPSSTSPQPSVTNVSEPVSNPDPQEDIGNKGWQDKSNDRSVAGQEYTWRDGARSHRVNLEGDLVVQLSSENTDGDVVARDDGETSIVRKQARHEHAVVQPVFRSQSGELMTLPGGVLLVLDEAWGHESVSRFFADNGIANESVQKRSYATNAFFLETDPGFPSLNLANRLARQEGVLISSPNWQMEVSLR
ncbi:MAG: hypothetical protein CL897_01560 [Dehalococcoidia bacterium]|nr:hypothetical protein [Dehalococcoidia bacterium]